MKTIRIMVSVQVTDVMATKDRDFTVRMLTNTFEQLVNGEKRLILELDPMDPEQPPDSVDLGRRFFPVVKVEPAR